MFDILVGLSNVVGAALALVAIAVALGVGTIGWQRFYLGQLRWRRIGKRIQSFEPGLNRREFLRSTYSLLDRRLIRGEASTVQEINWLTGLIGAVEEEHVEPYRRAVQLPFTFGLAGVPPEGQSDRLRDLADAYREYGTNIRRRWMLRTAAAPIVSEEYEATRKMVELIDDYARTQRTAVGQRDLLRAEAISLAPTADGFAQWVKLVAHPDFSGTRRAPRFAAVNVSYAPYRVLTSDKSIAYRTLPHDVRPASVLEPHEMEPSSGCNFDGIMSRLHGKDGYRVEIDPHSGRERLHLCISETSFFAFRLTQWNETDPLVARRKHAFESRLFSVNLMLVDDDDRVLLVRRASRVTHGGQFAGAVSGACEVVDRDGIDADIDAYGIPNPMAAVVREAREELGIDVSPPERRLGAIGLIEVMSPRDMHTHVLVTTARIEGKASDFQIAPGSTDDIEGTWEIGRDMMIVDMRAVLSTTAAITDFVGWLRCSPEILPHALGGLVLLLLAKVEHVVGHGEASVRRSALVDALTTAVAPVPSDMPSSVAIQPLAG